MKPSVSMKWLYIIVIGIILGFCLIPVKVSCGWPKGMCIRQEDGFYKASYVMEPWIVKQIETLAGIDIPLEYAHGDDILKAIQ